jgi:hypothetical protein
MYLAAELGQVRRGRVAAVPSARPRDPEPLGGAESVHEAVDYLCKYRANLWATGG